MIQSQDVVAAFTRMTDNPATRARRLAVLIGSALARMQAQRIGASETVRISTERDRAMAWLFPDESDASASGAP